MSTQSWNPNDRPLKSSFSRWRRWGVSVNVGVSIVAALVVLTAVNYIASLYYQRFHWVEDARYRISDYTRAVLDGLEEPVRVVVYFDRDRPVFPSVDALLNEYRAACSQIRVETVDYLRHPAAAEAVRERYPFDFQQGKNVVIFDNGERTQTIHEDQLSDYSVGEGEEKSTVRRSAFKGEQLFTSALLNLQESEPARAYFVTGHREHDPKSTSAVEGYSKFADLLRQNNVETDKILLSGTNTVPKDCELLILAGPRNGLLDTETRKIDDYLRRGGRMLTLLRSRTETGMGELLDRWGVRVGSNVVVDRPNSVNRNAPYDLSVTNFGVHSVVRPLNGSQLYLVLPRSVEKKNGRPPADAPKVEELFFTGKSGEALSDIREGAAHPSSDDRRGAIPLAVAVEEGAIQGVGSGSGATRMVVVGESMFLGNRAIDNFANFDFAALALNWLLDRSRLTDKIPPRPVRQYQLSLTNAQRRELRWILLGGMPGAVLGLGLIVWWARRR